MVRNSRWNRTDRYDDATRSAKLFWTTSALVAARSMPNFARLRLIWFCIPLNRVMEELSPRLPDWTGSEANVLVKGSIR